MEKDFDTLFMSGLLELQYGQDVEGKLREISENVSWAKGWPESKKSFWNAEAFMRQHKIEKEKRELISSELAFLDVDGRKNLDVGCGAYSYLPSTGFDLSEKMLQFNDNCMEKVQGDLEGKLPFSLGSFDSVTAIFVLNYVKNYNLLLREVKRMLRVEGVFVMVISAIGVNGWQRQKQVNSFSDLEWKGILEENGFNVKSYEKDKLWFLVCENNRGGNK